METIGVTEALCIILSLWAIALSALSYSLWRKRDDE